MKRFSYITGTERAGIAVAAVTATAALLLTVFTGTQDGGTDSAPSDSLASDMEVKSWHYEKHGNTYSYNTEVRRKEVFPFDPNTADSTQLLRLGLQPWQVRNIYKYRARGGVYRRKTDFAKLYGLTLADYRRLEPYIRISPDYLPVSATVHDTVRTVTSGTAYTPQPKLKAGQHIDVNTADSTHLRLVPGIGAYFSRRITWYRERLGGFYSVRQLMEIDGFPEQALSYFTADAAHCRRININTAAMKQLRSHPYITFNIARTIVEHRRSHGKINSLADLKLYRDFTPEVMERLKNYVEF